MSVSIYERSSYPAGTCIFKEGEAGYHIYIVESGLVHIVKNIDGHQVTLTHCPPGSLFGEMALLDHSARSADAMAVKDSVCTKIPALTVQEQLERCPPLVPILIKILVHNMRHRNENLCVKDADSPAPAAAQEPGGQGVYPGI